MAQLRKSSSFNIICGGYWGEDIKAVPEFHDEPIGSSGSQEIIAYFHNSSYTNDTRAQKVDIRLKYTWNADFDAYNNCTLHLRTEVLSVTASRTGAYPGGYSMFFSLGAQENHRPYYFRYNMADVGQLGGYSDLGWRDFYIPSGGSSSVQTLFVRGGFTYYESYGGGNGCYKDYIDKMQGGITFSNPNPTPKLPPDFTLNCSALNGNSGSLSAKVDYRNGTGANSYEYCVSGDSLFSNCSSQGTGNGDVNKTIIGLAPNTRYYARVTANNGNKSTTKECSFVTLVPNQITNAVATSPEEATIRFTVQYGNKVYPPTTTIRYRKCSGGSWVNGPTSTTTTIDTVDITGLEDDTCYQVQAVTTTTAGTYYGNVVDFTTPKKGAFAYYNKIEPVNAGAPTYETTAELCYDWTVYEIPATITAYYRVKNGYKPDWIVGDTFVVDSGNPGDTGERCFTLHDLFPNQTVYETYIHTSTEHAEWDGDISEFTTPLLPKPENHNCENLQYLLDLLCQAITALPNGIKTIFANPTTKEMCDPYSDNPTLATLWSRILRFDHAAACLMCDMVDMALKSGRPGQYYAGEIGWADLITKIEEDKVDKTLASSDAIYNYLYEKLHSVWHMHGSVDYIVGESDEFPADAVNGSTAIVTSLNQIWKKTNGSWAIDQKATDAIDNFSVYHINKASNTSFGPVLAESAYYFFGDRWNHLDADTDQLIERLKKLEDAAIIDNEDGADPLSVEVVPFTYDIENADCDGRKVYFVTEPLVTPAVGYHLINFITGPQATIVQNQEVLDGATAQKPEDPSRTGYTFAVWTDQNDPDIGFNWNLPIKKDYTVVAQWDPIEYTVSFDLNGGSGSIPAPITANYGETITVPDGTGFSREGAEFAGWMRDGVEFTSDTPVVGDTTLVAFWTMDEFDVTLDAQNGEEPVKVHIKYNEGIQKPDDPHNGDNVFVGWYTSPSAGEPVDFSQFIKGPVTYYAHWVSGFYNVTFDSAGGTTVPNQIVAYRSYPMMPKPEPTNGDMVFGGWMLNGMKYYFNTPITSDVNLVARWLEVYTVKFVDSFGDTVSPDQEITEGSAFGPRIPEAPARDGYTFDGWYTTDGRKWNVDVDTVTSDMTLVAVYKES